MTTSDVPPNLLTIPCELRNTIYSLIFDPSVKYPCDNTQPPCPDEVPVESDTDTDTDSNADNDSENDRDNAKHKSRPNPQSLRLSILLTCRQIHSEAHLMALSYAHYLIPDAHTQPDCFLTLTAPLRATKLRTIRHLTLNARISQLRALNEAWDGRPFGNDALALQTLTIVPRRPDVGTSAYAEVAALSQCHALAYVFGEAFRTLRGAETVVVRNEGCFEDSTWRIVYRSLMFRMWRWAGGQCGVRFECAGDEVPAEAKWFKAHFGAGCAGNGEVRGFDVGEEVVRIAMETGELPPEFGTDP